MGIWILNVRTIEDELLKWRFKRGSREALARIYEKHVNALLNLAIGLLNDPHTAEDAAAPGSPAQLDRTLVYSERCERLSAALAQLPYEQREAVVLKTKHEMKLRDIARLQGVSISTVHGRYRYGMNKLRALLNGDMDHER